MYHDPNWYVREFFKNAGGGGGGGGKVMHD